MDSFGIGTLSLGLLSRYSFDKIKVDRSFLLNDERKGGRRPGRGLQPRGTRLVSGLPARAWDDRARAAAARRRLLLKRTRLLLRAADAAGLLKLEEEPPQLQAIA